MTKDFALGGLRLGYVLGAPALIQVLQAAQPPWNVNLLAQVAGAVALRDGLKWRRSTLTALRKECALLQEGLRGAGYQPYPTAVNYFLVPVHSPATLRDALLARRLIVRDCTSFGLPNFIRIAVQRPEANARLMQALIELAPTAVPSSHTI